MAAAVSYNSLVGGSLLVSSPLDFLKNQASLQEILTLVTPSTIDQKYEGRTLLSWAISLKRLDIAPMLIDKGASLDSDDQDYDPTRLLVTYDDAYLEALAKGGAKIRETDPGSTLKKLLFLMLQKQPALVNKPWSNFYGSTLLATMLDQAEEQLICDVLPFLAAATRLDKFEDNQNVLHLLIQRNMHDLMEKYFKGRKDLIDQLASYGSTLALAAKKGFLESVQWLIENGADINAEVDSFEQAAIEGHASILTLLINKIQLVDNLLLDRLLRKASCHGHLQCVKILVKKGAQVNPSTKPEKAKPLFVAAENGRIEIVKFLLEKGAYPNLAYHITQRISVDQYRVMNPLDVVAKELIDKIPEERKERLKQCYISLVKTGGKRANFDDAFIGLA